jgi:UDP-2-acetamido-2,6-beta-L-arabino-hexul-4-ose reductase
MHLLITGAGGFIGRNLSAWLRNRPDLTLLPFDQNDSPATLAHSLRVADAVVHLAGVNRPPSPDEFRRGNTDFTAHLCEQMEAGGRPLPVIFASSTQATQDNPYGQSKLLAEQVLAGYAERSGASVTFFRLPNVFGKWCRPHYNSVAATFCHQIARDLPVTISDPEREVTFVHVDDVLRAFMAALEQPRPGVHFPAVTPVHPVTLGRLADLLHSFRQSRQSLTLPDFSDPFTHKLYSTFLSYLPENDFGYDLLRRADNRGSLAEFVKSPHMGQIFVSRTHPGITRGDHYHHLKTEKFLVLEGKAIIRFRHIESDAVIEYAVDGEAYRVLDIPPGTTHSIENVGQGTLVTLFWASEIFDPTHPDTFQDKVLP